MQNGWSDSPEEGSPSPDEGSPSPEEESLSPLSPRFIQLFKYSVAVSDCEGRSGDEGETFSSWCFFFCLLLPFLPFSALFGLFPVFYASNREGTRSNEKELEISCLHYEWSPLFQRSASEGEWIGSDKSWIGLDKGKQKGEEQTSL